MEAQSHIIQQQILDISFPFRNEAHQLQNRMSELFNNRLNREIALLFDRLVPAERHLQLESLTVDAGTLSIHWRDEELEELVLAALEKEILQLLSLPYTSTQPANAVQDSKILSTTNYKALLTYFLLTGTIPWWASGDVLTDPAKVFYRLLNEDRESLKELILSAGRFEHVRRRLVYQFAPEVIKNVITILEPEQAGFIFDYHADTVKIQRQKNTVKTESSELEKELWLFILTYLFVDRGTTFNRKAFVKAAIGQMAQHYNLKYLELLNLFTTVLADIEITLKTSSYLPFIIKELRYEEFVHQNHHIPAANESEINDDDVPSAFHDLNIIRYFLVFGSLPWWAEPYHSDQLSAMLMRLIKSVPQSLNEMIVTVGKLPEVRKRLVLYFNEEIYTELVEVIEPSNAGLIINYADEMYNLQVKNSIIKTDSKEFKTVMWELILSFLLAERGSVFNANTFLEFNIRKIAQVYHIKYADLLAFIIQGIGQIYTTESEHVQFFQMLTGLLNNLIGAESTEHVIIPNTVADLSLVEIQNTAGLLNNEQHPVDQVLLKNILLYWLTYGAMPWWAGEYMHHTIDGLFDKLIAEAPDAAITILKAAGRSEITRQRLIYQLSDQTLAKLFALLPPGVESISASALIAGFLQLLNNISGNLLQENRNLGKDLYLIYWNIYIKRNNTAVDTGEFVLSAVNYIAGYDQQGEETLLLHMRKEVLSASADDYHYQLIINALERIKPENISETSKSYVSSELPVYLNAADVIISYLPADKKLLRSAVLDEALRLLRFFLVHNRLPSQLSLIKDFEMGVFLKQLMVMLHYELSADLHALLKAGDNHHREARIHIHDIFKIETNAGETAVARLLDQLLEADIFKFVKNDNAGSLITGADLAAYVNDHIVKSGRTEDIGLIKTLLKHVSVAGYLAHQLEDRDVYQLMGKSGQAGGWRSETVTFVQEVQQLFQSLITDSLERERLGLLFREFNLLVIGGHYSFTQPKEYLTYLFRFIASRRYVLIKNLSALLTNTGIDTVNLSAGIISMLPEIIDQLQINSHDTGRTSVGLNAPEEQAIMERIYGKPAENLQEEEMQSVKRELAQEDRPQSENIEKDAIMNGESIYIQNAGLVLLHPFFATYFKRLGMLEDNKFINPEAQLRAVHLLQYLVTGTEKHPEHELPLNKILCNLPLQDAVPMEVILTEQEKQVSHELLHAVLNNWDKLKNTSVEGLRSSFLQRSGVLTWKDESWNLRVEQRGYDVLLQTIPWNISMIKTSWMTNFLYVEWI